MPDVQEVFETATHTVRPDPGALERQFRARRRRAAKRRASAIAIAGILSIIVTLVLIQIGLNGDGAERNLPAAQPSALQGKIAFTYSDGSTSRVFTSDPDGSDRTVISQGVTSTGSWSPDGTKILVDRGTRGLFEMNADGSDPVKIADAGERPKPNGRYALETGPGLPPASPAWSPDGTKILFTRWANDPVVHYSDAQQERIGSSLLAIVSGSSHLFEVNADGSGLEQLTFGAVADFAGSWSPDGSQIIFTRNTSDESGIYVMDSDGSDVHRILATGPIDSPWPPSWSPDGSKILFAQSTSHVVPRGLVGIYVMDSDGSNVTKISPDDTYEDSPAWSPDGRKIVFAGRGIEIMNADGSGRVQITRSAEGYYEEFEYPAWGP